MIVVLKIYFCVYKRYIFSILTWCSWMYNMVQKGKKDVNGGMITRLSKIRRWKTSSIISIKHHDNKWILKTVTILIMWNMHNVIHSTAMLRNSTKGLSGSSSSWYAGRCAHWQSGYYFGMPTSHKWMMLCLVFTTFKIAILRKWRLVLWSPKKDQPSVAHLALPKFLFDCQDPQKCLFKAVWLNKRHYRFHVAKRLGSELNGEMVRPLSSALLQSHPFTFRFPPWPVGNRWSFTFPPKL